MDIVETFILIGKVGGAFVALWGFFKLVSKGYRRLRLWKVIKVKEYEALKAIEAQHQKCEVEKERLRKLDNPMANEIRRQLDLAKNPSPVRVVTDHSIFGKNR